MAVTYQKGGLICVGILSVAIEAVGIHAWRRGSPNAGFFLAGWTGMCCLTALGTIFPLGVTHSFWLYRGGAKLGAVTEALVLSLGLANRVNRMRLDKERIQRELIDSRTAQAASLEKKVAERTAELHTAMDTLQSTQSRMMKQARLASLGHLVAGVAHEVGNPLNFTRGGALEVEKQLDVIAKALDAGPAALTPAREALGIARRAAQLVSNGNERIRSIVDHLRGYASARLAPIEGTDLLASLEQTLTMMATQLEGQSVRVVRDLQPLPIVPCHPGELAQVFMNLILNSCKAMPDGGELRIEARSEGSQVELRFSDTGPGIPPQHRDAIFDPFFTTGGPNEGTGLGLSISHEIVRRHGGELELADSLRGASFVIRIPVAPVE